MSAQVSGPSGQESKKLVGFGGTGKAVALIYAKLGKLLGESSNIVICDFPASNDPNSADGRLDLDLQAEGFGQPCRINTLPDDWIAAPRQLVEHLDLDNDVADALFTDKQQRTPPSEGLNQEPQVGATVARTKIDRDGQAIRDRTVTPGQDEIFLVAGLGGGTGTGMAPSFARFLRTAAVNCRLHGVFLLPWQDIGEEAVGNAGQRRNAASLLRYLRDHHADLFDSTLILGGFPGLEMLPAAEAAGRAPVHPTLILAALYVHMWHAWGGGAQLTSRLNRLETATTGIRLDEITGREGTLAEMLARAFALELLLSEIIEQHPDEVLAWLSLWPLSASLAWRMNQALLKKYCRAGGRPYGMGWVHIRGELGKYREREQQRREWILRLVGDRRVFTFDSEELEERGRGLYRRAREILRRDDRFRNFQVSDPQHALEEVSGFICARAEYATLEATRQSRRAAAISESAAAPGTRVWLPLPFPGAASSTQFTALDPAHLDELARYYVGDAADLTCPEIMASREVFRWRLEKDLDQGRGRALEDFALLVEGLSYGLLTTKTYDLRDYGLDGPYPHERFLTVLKFRTAPGAPESIAGSFGPDTLVAPAARWGQRNALEHHVQRLRFTNGPRARALLKAFRDEFPAPDMLWYRALNWLLETFRPASSELVGNQANAGPVYLRMGSGARPKLLFLPQFREGWLEQLARVFRVASYQTEERSTRLYYSQHRLGEIVRELEVDDPKIFGLGNVALETDVLPQIPRGAGMPPNRERQYLEVIQPITVNYQQEIEQENNRFLIPDSLRCAFHLWGPGARQKLLRGRLPHIYGSRALRSQMQPPPHSLQGADLPGLWTREPDTLFYVSRIADDRRAYHIERLSGNIVGELSALGYALWRVFCGENCEDLIEEFDGWVGAKEAVQPRPPDRRAESVRWSTFLATVNDQPQGLFRTAAEIYIEKFGPGKVPASPALQVIQLQIAGQPWFTLQRP